MHMHMPSKGSRRSLPPPVMVPFRRNAVQRILHMHAQLSAATCQASFVSSSRPGTLVLYTASASRRYSRLSALAKMKKQGARSGPRAHLGWHSH